MKLSQIGVRFLLTLFTFSIGVGGAWLTSSPNKPELSGDTEKSAVPAPPKLEQRIVKSASSPMDYAPLPLKFPDVWDSQSTVAGQLEIVENNFLDWKITLNGKNILSETDELPPHILKRVQRRVTPYDEVVVLTGEGGTCCEITRFWFLGLRADGSHYLSKKIEAGWVEEPHITVGKDYVKAKIKGGPENHGDGYLPGGVWIFQNRSVRKVK